MTDGLAVTLCQLGKAVPYQAVCRKEDAKKKHDLVNFECTFRQNLYTNLPSTLNPRLLVDLP